MPAPNTPQDIIDRLRAMERQIAELNGRLNIRPALNTIVGGSVTIKGGGALVVEDTNGDSVLRIGQVDPDVDGEPQQATVIRRMDGSLAFAVWTSQTTGAQPVRMYDKDSKVIFADDLNNGGLAQPWIPLPSPVDDNVSNWASTTSGSYTTILRSRAWLQHPKLRIRIGIGLSASTSGNLRFLVDGNVVATGSTDSELLDFVDVPSWVWNGVPQSVELTVQARRTSGSGSVFAQTRYVYGAQT